MRKPVLYLVSTPLHFLVASSLAIRHKDSQKPYLLFIDQRKIDSHPYYICEEKWPESPFSGKDIIAGVGGLSLIKKLSSRRRIFQKLSKIIKEVCPEVIYVGNDRRIEFQYSMHLSSLSAKVEGVYMDEGIFTYVGRKESSSFKDRIIDNYLKKLAYGRWWKNPPTIGGSDWVSKAFVAFPDHVHRLLKNKKLEHLDSSYFSAPDFKSLASIIVEHFSINPSKIENLDLLVALPHESVMGRVPGYTENVVSLVEKLAIAGKNIGVKYHPRNSSPDILNIGRYSNVWIIPDGAAFESFLPMLNDCVVVGDMSSVLLTTRWLRPDLKVIAIENRESEYFSQFRPLFNSVDIEIMPGGRIVEVCSSFD